VKTLISKLRYTYTHDSNKPIVIITSPSEKSIQIKFFEHSYDEIEEIARIITEKLPEILSEKGK